MRKLLSIMLALAMLSGTALAEESVTEEAFVEESAEETFVEESVEEDVFAEESAEEESALAEEPLYATIKEALEEVGDDYYMGGNEDYWIVAFLKEGKGIRLITELDDAAREKWDRSINEGDYEKRIALLEEFDEYVAGLPVSFMEEITAEPIGEETLESYVGLTVKELTEKAEINLFYANLADLVFDEMPDDDKWEEMAAAADTIVTKEIGLYDYNFTLDITRGDFEEICDTEEGMADLKITAAAVVGLNRNMADPEYLADGTFTGQTDVFGGLDDIDLGPAGDLINIIMEAINSNNESGKTIDTEALIESLIPLMPDQEDLIRQMVPLLMSLTGQEEEETAGVEQMTAEEETTAEEEMAEK